MSETRTDRRIVGWAWGDDNRNYASNLEILSIEGESWLGDGHGNRVRLLSPPEMELYALARGGSPVYQTHVGVTGGRHFRGAELVDRAFATLLVNSPLLIHGGASGADEAARLQAERLGWETRAFAADWERPCDANCRHGGHRPRRRDGTEYCPSAGPIRNQEMVDFGLDILLAFEGNRGTEDMVRRAAQAGVLVLRVGNW